MKNDNEYKIKSLYIYEFLILLHFVKKYMKNEDMKKWIITYEGSFRAINAADSVLLYGTSSNSKTFNALLITWTEKYPLSSIFPDGC